MGKIICWLILLWGWGALFFACLYVYCDYRRTYKHIRFREKQESVEKMLGLLIKLKIADVDPCVEINGKLWDRYIECRY